MTEQDQKVQETGPDPKSSKAEPRRGARWGIIVLITALVTFAALAGAGTRRMHRYVTKSPDFCASCHVQVKSEIGAHAHVRLECGSCHDSGFAAGLRLLVTPSQARHAKHGEVDLGRCKNCHFDQRRDSKTARSIGHQNHVTTNTKLSCDKCHNLAGHKTSVDARSCGSCHDKVTVQEHGMSQVACLSCHQFIKEGKAGDPGATGCPTCHGGKPPQPGQSIVAIKTKAITASVVHGNVNACRLCHEPHRPDPSNRRQGKDCASCHKRIVEQHREANIRAHENCAECHEVHGPRPKTPDLCVRCHTSESTKSPESRLSARHQGCSGCHAAHRFEPEATQCAQCHEPVRATLSAWNAKSHANCLSCHSGHSGKSAATACPACHEKQRGHGHAACTQCHEPHKDKSTAKQCSTCHQPVQQVIGAAKVPQHRACISCHETHAAPQANMRCAGCHGKQANQVANASLPAHQACRACHLPHQFASTGGVCRNCHKADGLGAHRDSCLKCHEAHGAPGRPKLECRSCHDAVSQGRGAHADCTSCHAVHKQPQGGPACVACHQSHVAATNVWNALPHQKCSSCHVSHSDRAPKSCNECHQTPTTQSLAAGHQCVKCHNPHQPPVRSASICVNCHRPEAAAIGTSTPTHANCIKCHDPHSRTQPTCQSCHTTKPFAHAFKGHQRCADCHKTHEVGFKGKEKCLSCHKDKLNHYPKAATCLACHNFR